MANSGNRIGDFTDEMEQATGEVVSEVKDAVGEMIEQGVQSITGKQLTPQQIQQKQADNQKELTETRRKLRWYQDLQLAQRKVREEEKEKGMQRQQLEEDRKQQKKTKDAQNKQTIISPAKKTPAVPGQPQEGPKVEEEIARSKQEIGKGHGIGG